MVAALLRIILIAGSLPYPQNVDEQIIVNPAMRIAQNGDLNPHFFRYPSLPFYLTALGLKAGLIWNDVTGGKTPSGEIDAPGYPYYGKPEVIVPARALFSALSLATLVCAGFIAVRVSASAWAGTLVMILLSLSPTFLYTSWRYITVDLPAMLCAALSIGAALNHLRKEPGKWWYLWLGIPIGLAIASKYNLGIVSIAAATAIAVDGRGRSIRRIGLVALVAFLAWMAAMPFAIIDLPAFFEGLYSQFGHYAGGHDGATYERGFDHLTVMLQTIFSDFGPLVILLALLGAADLLQRNWRSGLVLLSFPIAYLLFMSLFKVFFPRNLLSILIGIGILAAAGVVALFRIGAGMLHRLLPKLPDVAVRATMLIFTAVLTLATANWPALTAEIDAAPDSRNQLTQWLLETLPPGTTVIVPAELCLATEPLAERFSVKTVPFKWQNEAERDRALRAHPEAVILRPHYGFDPRRPKRDTDHGVMNRYFAARTVIIRAFGENPVMTNRHPPVFGGDPRFSVAILSPKAQGLLEIPTRRWREARKTINRLGPAFTARPRTGTLHRK